MAANIVRRELQLSELKQIEPSLNKLVQLSLPIKISYRMSKALKKISAELVDFEETRQALVKKYGILNEATQQISVPAEAESEFIAEIQSVLEEVVVLEFIPMNIDDLGDVSLTPADVINLELFFEDQSEETEA